MEYWTAFTMGLFGSLHCISMCGPIALSLPYQESHKVQTIFNILSYNFGRMLSYSIIGIIPGLLGLGIFISGYQTSLSIFLGILLLGMALFSINLERQFLRLPFYQKFNTWLQAQFSKHFAQRKHTTFVSIGILNGFLPCGMVYLAVAGAITQSGVIQAMLYMILFGLGTVPMMLIIALSGNWLGSNFRKQIFKAAPIILFSFGLIFLLRGLNVELPADISYWMLSSMQKMCH